MLPFTVRTSCMINRTLSLLFAIYSSQVEQSIYVKNVTLDSESEWSHYFIKALFYHLTASKIPESCDPAWSTWGVAWASSPATAAQLRRTTLGWCLTAWAESHAAMVAEQLKVFLSRFLWPSKFHHAPKTRKDTEMGSSYHNYAILILPLSDGESRLHAK